MEKYIKILKKMNKFALNNGDIPVSALIIKDNEIISKAYNTKYKKNDPLGHAEINAIKKACKKLKRTNLMDCTLIVTLKPCSMCMGLINEVRLKNVYYIIDNIKEVNCNIKFNKICEEEDYFRKEIVNFFKSKR